MSGALTKSATGNSQAHQRCSLRKAVLTRRMSPKARADAFEAEHDVELPLPCRDFLATMGGKDVSPYYGLIPSADCTSMLSAPPYPNLALAWQAA